MSQQFNEDRLVHYFAGECSEKESAEIEAWINADPARKRRVARLRQIWSAAEQGSREEADVDAMWASLIRRLGPSEFESEESEQGDRADRPPRPSRDGWRLREARRSRKLPAVVAAMTTVVIVTLVAWALYGSSVLDRSTSSMRTIATEVGQRSHITLGDGTRVTLNAESELTIPPDFGGVKRRVRLRGQAYFEVAPDKERPFLVHAGGSVTRVLGTRFDVGAYPEDGAVRVVVAEGTVSLRSEREGKDSGVRVKERQMASLSKSDRSVLRRAVDPAPYLAWTEGQLIFKDATFDEVVRRLNTWYGLEADLEGSTKAVHHLNAAFEGEPVEEVLTVIAETLNLRYEREGKRVTFYVEE